MPAKKKPRIILMPGEVGDTKTRKNYKKAGKVNKYFLEGGNELEIGIIPLEKLLRIQDPKTAQREFKKVTLEYPDHKIHEFWGKRIPLGTVKRIRKDLGIIKDRSGKVVKENTPNWRPEKYSKYLTDLESQELEIAEVAEKEGLTVTLTGKFTGKQLQDRLMGVMQVLGEGDEYEIKLTITEVKFREDVPTE